MPIAIILTFILVNTSQGVYAAQYQIDRYTYIQPIATQEQSNELDILIETSFPKSVNKIIPAVEYLLLRSSYQLVMDYKAEVLGNIDLPEVHKKIGPIKLKEAIKLLIGNSWKLEIDDINRTMTILLKKQQESQYVKSQFKEHLQQIVKVNIHKDSFESVIKKIIPNGDVWIIDAKPEVKQYKVSIVSEDLTRLEIINSLMTQIGIKGIPYPSIKTYIFRTIQPRDTTKEINPIIK